MAKSRPVPARAAQPGRRVAPARPARAGVAVVGALHMDLLIKAEMIPLPGQTVLGRAVQEIPGGKAANQAAAAGRLGARPGRPCRLVGRIGDDFFGQRLLQGLAPYRVDISNVLTTRNVPSGLALITVDRHGAHATVVAAGANARLSVPDLLARRGALEQAVVLTLQLEIPFETIACAIALAKQAGTLTILDPTPVPPEGLPESLFHVDILCPNQDAAHLLTGITVRTVDDARRAGEKLLGRGTQTVIVKMGPAGAVLVTRQPDGRGAAQHVPGFKVVVADPLGAGDTFTGALAVALAEGQGLPQAVRFANAAGALACTKPGGQSAIPTRAEVDALLAGKPK